MNGRDFYGVTLFISTLLATTATVRASQDRGEKEPTSSGTAAETKGEDKSSNSDAKSAADEESPIKRLAELRLDEFVVPARMINLPLPGKVRTVQDILDRFETWTKDERIGGVLLDVGNMGLSLPDVEELRLGVDRLRKSGKRVTAFLNVGGPAGYLLACAADEVVTPPTGSVVIPGLGAVFPFLKGHYQMRGIEFQVITAGRFKYPGFLNEREPGKYFAEEYEAILNSWIADYRDLIARSRNLSDETVAETIDIALFNAHQAQQRGLIDHLAYYDECRERILKRDRLRRQRPDDQGLAQVNSIQDMMELITDELRRQEEARKAVGPKIAVLHARGPIIDVSLGAGMASQIISRDDFVSVVDELRRNKSIKAVVMRVDSPGGSGYASDVIWQELRRLNEEKPLVVTMGRVAGSGGYYISCPARRVFAHPTTITGSIGVIGIVPMGQSMYNRMDYELAEMKRGARSLLGSPHRAISNEDRQFIQDYINDFYSVFVDRVALTRRLPAEQVRKIAEGRIYTGRQALELGLVDELGGLAEAIESARGLANIPPSAELKIVHYPRPGSLGEIFETFSAAGAAQVMDIFSQASRPAPECSFDQQLTLLSRFGQPLCWMADPWTVEPRMTETMLSRMLGSIPVPPQTSGLMPPSRAPW